MLTPVYDTDEALAVEKAPTGATANGRRKPAKAVKAKAARKAKAKASARGAKAPKAKAPRTVDPAKVDQFGFRKGSLKSKAAAMYAKGEGATLSQVKEALDSVQFNVLTELREKGFKITESQAKGVNRPITRYKVAQRAASR